MTKVRKIPFARIAEKLDVSYNTFMIRKRRNTPLSPEELITVLRMLNITLEQLMSDDFINIYD